MRAPAAERTERPPDDADVIDYHACFCFAALPSAHKAYAQQSPPCRRGVASSSVLSFPVSVRSSFILAVRSVNVHHHLIIIQQQQKKPRETRSPFVHARTHRRRTERRESSARARIASTVGFQPCAQQELLPSCTGLRSSSQQNRTFSTV